MQMIDDLVDPAVIVPVARGVQDELNAAGTYQLEAFLPDTNHQSARWESEAVGDGEPDAAQYRAFDTRNQTLERPDVLKRSGDLPPVGAQTVISEREQVALAALAAAGGAPDPVVEQLYADVPKIVRSMLSRAELARGQALSYGGVWIRENGVNAVADFGANQVSHPAQYPVAATLWSDPAAKPMSDLIAWSEAYEERTGELPAHIGMSSAAWGFFVQNDEVKEFCATAVARVPDAAITAMLETYGLPGITRITKKVRVDGVATLPIEPEKLIFQPADPIGETVWGITAHAYKWLTAARIGLEDIGGIVVAPYETDDPPQKFAVGAGTMIPVVARPEALFAAEVL